MTKETTFVNAQAAYQGIVEEHVERALMTELRAR